MEALDKEYPNERTEDDESPPKVCNFRKSDEEGKPIMPSSTPGWSAAAWTQYVWGVKTTVLGYACQTNEPLCQTAKWMAYVDCDGEEVGYWEFRTRECFDVDFCL